MENIEKYLEFVGRCRDENFGQRFRQQFGDNKGSGELAMLACPSQDEFEQFSRAVKVMTEAEKDCPEKLSDVQIAEIANSANADVATVAIFINGYILARKRADHDKG